MLPGQPAKVTADAFQRLLDGLQTLVREHLALARAEAKEDLRTMGRDLAVGAAGVPALAVGYLLLMIAFGFLLSEWLANWAAFGIVALVNLGTGLILTVVCRKQLLQRRSRLRQSAGQELQRDKAWLSSMPETTRPQPDGKLTDARPARLT
jgi:protein-S-isoprenylcysteine O-methyltransferase Ste14